MAKNVRQGGGVKAKAARVGNTISKARGKRPTAKPKPQGWAQNPSARADRVSNAAGRKREAAFLKSLPKPTRQAIRAASRSNSPLGAKYRSGALEGATILRGNFGKRKNALSAGRAAAIADSIAFSGRKLRVAVANPGVGRRLKPVGDQRKSRQGNIKAAAPKGTVGKPRGLKPSAIKVKPARIANRSAADQAHRDKVAKQLKSLEKPARRAIQVARANNSGNLAPLPRTPAVRRGKGGDARFIREHVGDLGAQLMGSPSRGKNKISAANRASIVGEMTKAAGKLRARAAITPPRKSTRTAQAARPGSTIRKPRGLKPQAVTASRVKAGDRQGVLGKVAQRRALGAAGMKGWQSLVDRGLAKAPHRNQTAKGPRIRGTVGMGEKAKVNHYVIQGGQRVAGRAQSKAIRAQAAKPVREKTAANVRKLSYDQRVQANEAKATGVRQTADTMRTTLTKSMRDAYKVSTVGGLVLKYAGTSGISRTQYSRLSDVVGAAGLSNIRGIRVTTNPNRSVHISLSRIARAQAAIGEKVASRPRRRRR